MNMPESWQPLNDALTESEKPAAPESQKGRESSIEAKLREMEQASGPELNPETATAPESGTGPAMEPLEAGPAPIAEIPAAPGSLFDVRRVAQTWQRYSNALAKMSPFIREIDAADAEFIAWSLEPIAPRLEAMLESWIAQWGGFLGALAVVYGPHAFEKWNELRKADSMADAGQGGER